MGETTNIEWCDHTFNPWIGCTKVSAGCANCYAEREMDHRHGRVKWGDAGTRSVTSYANWRKPLQWNAAAKRDGARRRVFCASLADVFEDWLGHVCDHNGAPLYAGDFGVHADCDGMPVWHQCHSVESYPQCDPDERGPLRLEHVRRELWRLIDRTPHLDWLLLTKRPENIIRFWPVHTGYDGTSHYKVFGNVRLMTSIEDQATADLRIPRLLHAASVLGLPTGISAEPLLGPVDLTRIQDDKLGARWNALLLGLNWVIVGGESGPHARPMHPNWARALRDQCADAGVPFFLKQWGEWLPIIVDEDALPEKLTASLLVHEVCSGGPAGYEARLFQCFKRVGKRASGHMLDGAVHRQFPVAEDAQP